LQATNAFLSAGAASPDEFYDLYAMDLEAEGQWGPRAAAVLSAPARGREPRQGIRCVGPNPTVAASGDRVFVTYGVGWPGQHQSVRVGVFDRSLRRLSEEPIGPVDARADRFWPASSLDRATGRVWVCFYDTSGDPSRTRAWYSCTSSLDGRRWSEPLRVARDSSSPDVLWEDARVYAFGDVIGFGGSTSVAAVGGVTYPFWIDTRDLGGNKQEVFTASLG
jgi:hypothetical protein